jgi:aminopeptidase
VSRIDAWTDKLADLAAWGANVQRGQLVAITSAIGKEELTRRIAQAAYGRGAKYVDVLYWDQWVKRERIALADEATLDFVPPWMRQRLFWLSEEHAARITLSGPHAPHALDGLDPARAGRDLLPSIPESGEVVNARTTSWCIVPAPTRAWAELVYPQLESDEAYETLWEAVAHICRLDADDPTAAWSTRSDELKEHARRLTGHRFDALRLRGPGTDLTLGLLSSSRWVGGDHETVDGLRHSANIPTEEVFTTPDPTRADGHVTATRPLELAGSIIRGLRVEFSEGRVVGIDADEGADALRAVVGKDEGASRLGEIALVDGLGRIGPLETVFYDTLIDENAATHIALGAGYEYGVEDADDVARVNESSVHVDFMIGSPDVEVDGLTREREIVPVLRQGIWQI